MTSRLNFDPEFQSNTVPPCLALNFAACTTSLEYIWTGGRSLNVIELTCGVEAKQQGTGDGKGQDPHGGNHRKNPLPGAMGGVIQDGHHHCCVPADTHTD